EAVSLEQDSRARGSSLAPLMAFARPPGGLRSPSARCAKLALAARNLPLLREACAHPQHLRSRADRVGLEQRLAAGQANEPVALDAECLRGGGDLRERNRVGDHALAPLRILDPAARGRLPRVRRIAPAAAQVAL